MASKRRVVITGTTGQLGGALAAAQRDAWEIHPLNRTDTNLLDWQAVRDRIASFAPDLVIHCAAATDVDGCERDPQVAYLGNAVATRHVARAAAACDAQLVYVSTNFVFDGTKPDPYHECDDPAPISVYGHSKLAGEREVLAATNRSFVVRTAMVYAATGRNFVLTMRRLMADRDRLTVVNDQFGNPTYAPDLAAGIVQLVERAPFGVYHMTNAGTASWYEWAREIAAIDGATTTIEPIPAAEYRRDATPPANGVLTSLSLPLLGIELPDWHDALRRCLAQ
ncbi:MAG TPA: dTDP-4-dehydrorhamnose reductase [Thermomicrobiales bacterium]|nr:dTDP-4-dehydrorhamnose reductase [Thermomicrobiales bacterium]